MYQLTSATKKIAALNKRLRIIQGGSSASKTVSILLLLINAAQSDTTPTITSVVSESFPHLKKVAIRDFLQIMEQHGYYKDESWNRTDYIYTFETGSKIEFFSADQPMKVKGPRRDRLFINEVNNVRFEAFQQLEIRTKEYIFLDFNPTVDFWLFSEIIGKRNDYDHIIVTYKDNEALDKPLLNRLNSAKETKHGGKSMVKDNSVKWKQEFIQAGKSLTQYRTKQDLN